MRRRLWTKKKLDCKNTVIGVTMAMMLIAGAVHTTVSIKAAEGSESAEAVVGDTNGDGNTDIADALIISRYDAGLIGLNEDQLQESDVNADNSVDIADALLISRYDAGLIELDKKGSNRQLFYRYVGETLVPKYGLAELNQSGTMTNSSVTWWQPRGIYSAEIRDLDGDGQDEMLVVYGKYVEKSNYSIVLEVYERNGRTVKLADSMTYGADLFAAASPYYKNYAGISLVTVGNNQYIVCEVQNSGNAFADGGGAPIHFRIIQYNGEKLEYTATFLKTYTSAGDAWREFTGTFYKEGRIAESRLLYTYSNDDGVTYTHEGEKAEESFETLDEALAYFFSRYGIHLESEQGDVLTGYYYKKSILSQENNVDKVMECIVDHTVADYQNNNHEFNAIITDYTDMRSKIFVKDAWVNAYAQLLYGLQDKNTKTIRFELGYVDEDEVPELFVGAASFHGAGISIYSYADDQLVFEGTCGSNGSIEYSVKNCIIKSNYMGQGHEVNTFYRLNAGRYEMIDRFDEVLFDPTCSYNYACSGVEVTKEEFDAKLKMYDSNTYDYVMASYDTAFNFSVENIQKFCQNPLDFINPNEK